MQKADYLVRRPLHEIKTERRIVMKYKLLIATALIVLLSTPAYADEKADLAKAAQNPVANMISLPLQYNVNTGIGPRDETQSILNIQPVWPVALNADWNLITRTILPVISQPDIYTGTGREDGLGDINFTAFFSPAKASAVTWGVGPTFVLPTATDDALGADKWSVGASAVVLAMPGKWVVGSLFSNIWSVDGSGANDVNFFTWQYFINYNLANGWYLTTAPVITANWEADSDNTWTVPFGGGAGKIFRIGKQPVNAQISAYNNVEAPVNGPEWQCRFQLQFLFPK
jgi:hypothetical protein